MGLRLKLRAQVAVEYASLVILVMVALIPIVYIGLTSIEDGRRGAQAAVAVSALVDAADLVFAQGPGARTIVDIYLPSAVNAEKTGIYGKEIRINVYMTNGAEHDYFALAKGNLTGSIPTTPGRHMMVVEMLQNGTVQIQGYGE